MKMLVFLELDGMKGPVETSKDYERDKVGGGREAKGWKLIPTSRTPVRLCFTRFRKKEKKKNKKKKGYARDTACMRQERDSKVGMV